jgi:hypothetical protein
LLYNHVFLLLKIRHLLRNELIQHLLLETEGRNSEVEHCDFDLSLRCVVRIRDCGSHKELEIGVPRDRLITES